MISRTLCMLFLFSLCLSITACSPGYVIQAAYEESKILLDRQDINDALLDPAVSDEQKEKLRYVNEARAFTSRLALEPGDSFTKYAAIDRDVLTWVVMGSEKDSFTLRGWWFPIVGTVPYKGFFEKEDAVELAKELSNEGYETWVRGADAFSTLGWFNDPVLSTTLKHPVHDVVDTVIHETLHATVWIPGSVDYNESLANYVGAKGAVLFFTDRLQKCPDQSCKSEAEKYLKNASEDFERNLELSLLIESLYSSLDSLYKSDLTKEEKLTKRESVFNEAVTPIRKKYPAMKALHSVNNAEIMQLKLYLTDLAVFDALYKVVGGDFDKFISEIKSVKDSYKDDDSKSPYELTKLAVNSLRQ